MRSLAATGFIAASVLAMPAASQAGVNIGIHVGGSRYNDVSRIAYDRGYEDGYHEGEKDGRHGDRFGFWDEGRYRDGDHGYKRNYGPRWEYTNAYRRGFESGYRRAYDVYMRYRYDDRDRYGYPYSGRDPYRPYDGRERSRDPYDRDGYRR
jgi:hypothetical protein